MSQQPSREQTMQHGWCLALKGSQAFAFYLSLMQQRAGLAHREVCAEAPVGSREFHAGRLSAFTECANLIDKRYNELKPVVEVLPE